MSERKVILLVEDLEDDILLVRRAFAAAKLQIPLQVVRDGEEAIDYLMGIGKYERRDEFPLPDLILLDLKMPKLGGLDVLRWIRSHPHLKALRVIVLTSSEEIYDVNKAYELGANSFLVKPAEFICYPSLVRTLEKFWLKSSLGPAVDRPSEKGKAKSEASN
jgi:CheY-like chemotaxis protein